MVRFRIHFLISSYQIEREVEVLLCCLNSFLDVFFGLFLISSNDTKCVGVWKKMCAKAFIRLLPSIWWDSAVTPAEKSSSENSKDTFVKLFINFHIHVLKWQKPWNTALPSSHTFTITLDWFPYTPATRNCIYTLRRLSLFNLATGCNQPPTRSPCMKTFFSFV